MTWEAWLFLSLLIAATVGAIGFALYIFKLLADMFRGF